MSNMDIVRNTSTVLADHVLKASVSNERSWKWVYQTVVFPEVKCPYCKECVTSTAVWFIEKESKLIGQAIPVEGGHFVLEHPDHPHAEQATGVICFGEAASAVHALFGSLNKKPRYMTKEGGYGGVPAWLAGKYFNHRCETIDKRLGLGQVPEEEDPYDYHCENCGDGLDDDDTYHYGDHVYCEDCFNERAFTCWNCGETTAIDEKRYDPDQRALCDTCFSDKWFTCECCSETIAQGDRRVDEPHEYVCKECFALPFFVACPCGAWYMKTDMWSIEHHKDHTNE